MFLELIVAVVSGICLGIITGLIPGIHVNLISILLLSVASILDFLNPIALCVIIISMAVTHTFLDTIPSVFLGAPDSNNVLSILPGHKLLLEGRGYEAVMLTVIGSLGALIICVIMLKFFLDGVKIIYPFVKNYIGLLILAIVIFLLVKERKFYAVMVFFLAGILGIVVLNLDGLKEPLFPLLSGLFGTSMLFLSANENIKIPEQKITEIKLKNGGKAIGCSVFAGWICSFMPGLGPSQAAILSSVFVKNLGTEGFLILVGGLSTVNMVLSLVTLYVLDKARNGAIVAVSNIIGSIDLNIFLIFISAVLIVGGVATILASKFAKIFSKIICKVNYRVLCYTIISLIFVLVFIISGFLGLLVLVVATFLGMVPALKGVGRNNMMGCLLIPVMSYFLL
ncbi:MAG: tripartite tricarboxylate transporter permease [Nanoarchaeota archaeon]|nr:tripartite tricarboxylate transporter permease [Nanoarchaeota archaeon]